MKPRVRAFLRDLLDWGVLSFGEFVLKSGRHAPYFFDFGAVSSGPALLRLGQHFAAAVTEFDAMPHVVFGPAYKGIHLATSVAIGLADLGLEVNLAFNRKEVKPHGEGGWLIGGELSGRRVLIVDDVVSDGTAKREAAGLVRSAGGILSGVLVALDREEPAPQGRLSASRALSSQLGVDVRGVASLGDLIEHLRVEQTHPEELAGLLEYRRGLLRVQAELG